MKNKQLLVSYLLLCLLLMAAGLYFGQASHSNCSRCNYDPHNMTQPELAGLIR